MYVLNLHRNFMEGDFGKRVLRDDKGVTCSFTLLKYFFYFFFFQLKNSFMFREDGLVAKRSLRKHNHSSSGPQHHKKCSTVAPKK